MSFFPQSKVSATPSDDVWKRRLAPTAQWKQSDQYLCGRCGAPVYANPYHSELLGCIGEKCCDIYVAPNGYEKHLKPRT